jgi:CrcB protein
MWQKLLLIAIAGALGTLARFGLSAFVYRLCGAAFPYGTLAVNVLGCFLFGFIWSLSDDRLIISGETRFILLVGFLGAFTTFSTFAFETSWLLRDSQWVLAFGNVVGQNVLGVVFVFVGLAVGRLL